MTPAEYNDILVSANEIGMLRQESFQFCAVGNLLFHQEGVYSEMPKDMSRDVRHTVQYLLLRDQLDWWDVARDEFFGDVPEGVGEFYLGIKSRIEDLVSPIGLTLRGLIEISNAFEAASNAVEGIDMAVTAFERLTKKS